MAGPPDLPVCPRALREAIAHFGVKAQDCLMVGDLESDQAAAAAAGVPFVWATEFFGKAGSEHLVKPNPRGLHRQELNLTKTRR